MLILTRGVDQTIVIRVPGQQPITVMVVAIRDDQVKLGISAPRDVAVHRSEVDQRGRP